MTPIGSIFAKVKTTVVAAKPKTAPVNAQIPAAPKPTTVSQLPPPAPPPPVPITPAPAPTNVIPGTNVTWDPAAYNPMAGTTMYGGPMQVGANGQPATYYAPPPPAPSYNSFTGVTTTPTAADVAAYNAATAGQVNNAAVLTAGGARLDNPYELDLSTNGLGLLLQPTAAPLDPADLTDDAKRRAILSSLGASDLEIRDLGYRGIVYDDELQSVAGVPQYTRAALVKIATLRVLGNGKVVPSSATNTGATMTAGQYYWRNTLAKYQAEQSAPPAPKPLTPLPVRALPTMPVAQSGGGVVLTIVAISAAVLALS